MQHCAGSPSSLPAVLRGVHGSRRSPPPPSPLLAALSLAWPPCLCRFMLAHLTDTDPTVREEGIPRTHGPAMYNWFAHAYT